MFKICQHFYSPNDKLDQWTIQLKNKFEREFNCELNSEKYKTQENCRLNSAFHYVLGNNSHYFLSNNLEVDEKNNYFYSSSNNYLHYYKSQGVFLLHHEIKDSNKAIITDPYGYLIIDSPHINLFDNNFISKLMLHFSHRINEFLDLLYKYQNNVQETN